MQFKLSNFWGGGGGGQVVIVLAQWSEFETRWSHQLFCKICFCKEHGTFSKELSNWGLNVFLIKFQPTADVSARLCGFEGQHRVTARRIGGPRWLRGQPEQRPPHPQPEQKQSNGSIQKTTSDKENIFNDEEEMILDEMIRSIRKTDELDYLMKLEQWAYFIHYSNAS